MFEGVYLYLMIVKVFNTVVRMRLFYAVAWGECYVSSINYTMYPKRPWVTFVGQVYEQMSSPFEQVEIAGQGVDKIRKPVERASN